MKEVVGIQVADASLSIQGSFETADLVDLSSASRIHFVGFKALLLSLECATVLHTHLEDVRRWIAIPYLSHGHSICSQ